MLNQSDIDLLQHIEADMSLGELGHYSIPELERACHFYEQAIDILTCFDKHQASRMVLVYDAHKLRDILNYRKKSNGG